MTLREGDEHVEAGDSSLFVADTADSDPNIFGSTEVKVVSVHDCALHEPPNQHVSKSPQETRKRNSKKRFKKLPLKKTANSSDVTNEVESLDMQNLPSEIEEKMENEDVVVIEKSEGKLQECEAKLKDASGKDQEKPKDKKKKKGSRALLENSNMESQDQIVTNDINHQAERKDAKKGKKKRSIGKEEELDEVFEVESSGEDVFQSEARRKSEEKKTKHSPIQEKSQRKSNQKLSHTKTSKSGSGNVPLTTGEDEMKGQPEPKEQTSQKKPVASTAGEMSSTSEKSSKKESVITEDKGEQLGDMSFLININSQISMFVADASQQERELQPMTARERNDVYKVTQLYKLRARIGTKTENNLTTVRLSKQADTRMPKPGRVDSLLSELSIAACKEAVKDSPKNHGKRKHPTSVEGNEQTAAEDSLDQAVPPKKKLSRLSRASKVHVWIRRNMMHVTLKGVVIIQTVTAVVHWTFVFSNILYTIILKSCSIQ